MAEKFDEAAVRHFSDAEKLAIDNRYDNAGHLIGLAAECAIKHTMRIAVGSAKKGHLPSLVEIAIRHVSGRSGRMHNLFTFLCQIRSSYFHDWDVVDRYAATGTVGRTKYESWHAFAEKTLTIASLRTSA